MQNHAWIMFNHAKTILKSTRIMQNHAYFMLKHAGIILIHGEPY